MKRTQTEELIERWEQAVAHATEISAVTGHVSATELNHVAGIQVKSGARAGVWGTSGSCDCTNPKYGKWC